MNEILKKIEDYGITSTEKLGQHFLIDDGVLDFIGAQVMQGSNVIEVGSGIGNLTTRLAKRARKVYGIEVDQKFREVLAEVSNENPNVDVFFQDALKFDYKGFIRSQRRNERDNSDWQIIANLPFNITEPFLRIIAGLPVSSIVLTIGDTSAESLLTQSPQSLAFTKNSAVAMAYYEVEKMCDLSRDVFYPPPRTDASIVQLVPADSLDKLSPVHQVIRYLLENENRMTVEQAVRQAIQSQEYKPTGKFIDKRRTHRHERRQLRKDLSLEVYAKSGERQLSKRPDLMLPEDIRGLRFSKLDNSQIRILIAILLSI